MSVWGRIFAGIYDHVMAKTEQAGLGAHRRALLAAASGDVLEIGAGTGTNLLYYEGKGLQTLTLTEPEKPMARRLKKRILERRPDAKLLRAPAEDLPFNDDSFDTVVATLVLCTVDDQPRALRELRRVLRPGSTRRGSSSHWSSALPRSRHGAPRRRSVRSCTPRRSPRGRRCRPRGDRSELLGVVALAGVGAEVFYRAVEEAEADHLIGGLGVAEHVEPHPARRRVVCVIEARERNAKLFEPSGLVRTTSVFSFEPLLTTTATGTRDGAFGLERWTSGRGARHLFAPDRWLPQVQR